MNPNMIESCNFIEYTVASEIIVFKSIDNISGGNYLFLTLYLSMLFLVSDHIQLRQTCYSIVNTHREVTERIFTCIKFHWNEYVAINELQGLKLF